MIVIIRALDIDISADTGPLPYAVKKPDANILKPQSRSAIDRYLVPVSAISNSSLPGREYHHDIFSEHQTAYRTHDARHDDEHL